MSHRALLTALALLPLTPALGSAQAPDSVPPVRWSAVAVSGGLLAAAALLDVPSARSFRNDQGSGMRQTADRLARFGTPTVIAPTLGALLAIGVLGHRPRLTRLALTGVEGMVITTVLVQGSKFAVGRTRPYADPDLDGSDFAPFSGSASFPSGHTAAAFALATTLGDGIGGPWARIGLYALATGTAWARMAQEQHWLSDVTGGAALGILAAKLAEGRRRLFGVRLPLLAPGPHALRIGWAGVPWN